MKLTITLTKKEQQALKDYNDRVEALGVITSKLPICTLFAKLAKTYKEAA